MPVEPMTAPSTGVKVRMYRQGLGDCFLLAFPDSRGDPFYILIDCGVIVGQVEGRPSINEVAEHISQSTNGRLDVVVGTHQHWDHLSGFVDADQIFKKMSIGELWLAWTEDPKDDLARRLRGKRKTAVEALKNAALHMADNSRSSAALDTGFGVALANVLGFLGADAAQRTTEQALKNLQSNLKANAAPRYLKPTDSSFALPGVSGVRVYVLGPPQDEQKIKSYNDRVSDPQTYHSNELTLATQTEFIAAAFDDAHDSENAIPRAPFDLRHEVRKDSGRYEELRSTWFGPGNEWRDISLDWLRGAATLALNLDNATNNTSLALAIELGPKGKVLLFPADAQVGNWLSWHDQNWQDESRDPVTAKDLLSRTVLYKVGHHCSHNATLRQRGLELMASDELIALSPLDVATAKNKHWPMPWPMLRTSLLKATKGRILQVDDENLPAGKACPSLCDPEAWSKFQTDVIGNDMYFEVTIANN